MSRNSEVDYVNEGTFKSKLPKLYQLAVIEGLRNSVELINLEFINCESINDIIEVNYFNDDIGFYLCVRGSERRGYRILDSRCDRFSEEVIDSTDKS